MPKKNPTGDQPQSKKCPSCGACQECGHRPTFVPYPVYPQPYNPFPYTPWRWNYPNTAGGSYGPKYTYTLNTAGNYLQ